MGLDNYIVARVKDGCIVPHSRCCYEYDNGELEFVYWRKCWNLRSCVADAMSTYYDDVNYTDLDHSLNRLTLIEIRKQLWWKLTHPKFWEDEGDCIWTWKEYVPVLLSNIRNLGWLIRHYECMEEVRFVDSY